MAKTKSKPAKKTSKPASKTVSKSKRITVIRKTNRIKPPLVRRSTPTVTVGVPAPEVEVVDTNGERYWFGITNAGMFRLQVDLSKLNMSSCMELALAHKNEVLELLTEYYAKPGSKAPASEETSENKTLANPSSAADAIIADSLSPAEEDDEDEEDEIDPE